MDKKRSHISTSGSGKKNKIVEKAVVFLLLLSAAFSITYWAMAKYDVSSDYRACGDTQSYIKMSYGKFEGIQQRYRHRIVMPFFVSLLNKHLKISDFLSKYYEDVDKKIIQFNFGIVNILAIALTAFIFFYYCLYLQFSKLESLLGCFLFLTSFFVVNYYTIPLVESLSTLFLMGGFYAVMRGSLWGIFLSFLLGIFTRETNFVLVFLILLEERKFFTKKLLVCVLPTIMYALFVIAMQKRFGSDQGFFVFKDALNIIQGKLLSVAFPQFSLYTLIENIQTYMFVWILFIYALLKCKKPVFLKRCTWLMFLPLSSPFLGAGVVGRAIFTLFPIVIPFALLAIRDILGKSDSDLNVTLSR